MTEYKYETFDEVIDALNQEEGVSPEDFPEDFLDLSLWISSWGWPGHFLPEKFEHFCTKKDALSRALLYCQGEDSEPIRGARTALRNCHQCDLPNGSVVRIDRYTLSDLFC